MTTIFSLVTKPIKQNIAVIRISGPKSFDIISKLFEFDIRESKKEIIFKKFFFKKKFVDDVILLKFKAPNSFTGEDVVELQFHGSMFIVKTFLEILKTTSAVLAQPGEFTERAFLNGKLDLTQAAAINSLILSETKILSEQSSKNLNSHQTIFINELILELENIMSRIYISIDYPENTDLPKVEKAFFLKKITNIQNKINAILKSSANMLKISDGINISFIGKPNVGKSTLMNLILGEERAIVSSMAGTTRDVITESFLYKDIKFFINDTAGHRKTSKSIESLGIKKTDLIIEKSDLIVLLFEPENILEQQKYFENTIKKHGEKIIICYTKSDVKKIKNSLQINNKDSSYQKLLDKIYEKVTNDNFEYDEKNSLLININQIEIFDKVNKKLLYVLDFLKKQLPLELFFVELEQVLNLLNTFLGKTIDPDYIQNLFSNFCIGK